MGLVGFYPQSPVASSPSPASVRAYPHLDKLGEEYNIRPHLEGLAYTYSPKFGSGVARHPTFPRHNPVPGALGVGK